MKTIQILDWTYTDKESEVDINKYIFKRERGKKKGEKFDYKYIDESRLGLLTVRIKVSIETVDPKDNEVKPEEKIITKKMLIPLQDEEGHFLLNGKSIYLIMQLVEKSTYTAPNALILKSLMPFAIRRYAQAVTTTKGENFKVPRYTLELFRKDVDIMLIYAATGGMNYALQFAMDSPYVVMNFVEEEDPDDLMNIYFRISNKLLLKVDKEMFDKFIYVRSVVGSIMHICTNRLTLDTLDNLDIWLAKLGGGSNADKGRSQLSRAARLLDETTERILRLDEYHKHDVASLARWMCQEYNDLRLKDNMDLRNKRLRGHEIISAMFTMSLSTRLNRIMSLGKKATMGNYDELFAFPGDRLKRLMSPLNLSNCGELESVG
jgi:hypothetical protein